MASAKFILFLTLLISLAGNAQIGGKARHLPGTWKYKEGTGYAIWQMNGNTLTGKGYRTNTVGDSILVETITVVNVNKNLSLKLETPQQDSLNTNTVYRFVANGRKLDFINIENEMPERIRYKFCFFNKRKMKILIYLRESDKPQKLKLYRL